MSQPTNFISTAFRSVFSLPIHTHPHLPVSHREATLPCVNCPRSSRCSINRWLAWYRHHHFTQISTPGSPAFDSDSLQNGRSRLKEKASKEVRCELVYVFVLRAKFRTPSAAQAANVSCVETLQFTPEILWLNRCPILPSLLREKSTCASVQQNTPKIQKS